MMTIEQNAQQVAKIIDQSLKNSLYREHPQTIVVTKTQSFEDISKLYALGYRHFGENRVDALLKRQLEFLQDDIVWHLIGTLQTRKVKDIIQHIDYFHALDRMSLIDEIEKRATTKINCFVQLNIFNESNKHGFAVNEINDVLDYIVTKTYINIVGLMAMAPMHANNAVIEQTFRQLKQLQQRIEQEKRINCPCHYLSIGMSLDYPIAVSCGATHVRIGSAFFKK